MPIPYEVEPQPFFLVVDPDTGEIYCAHQEYTASDRRLLARFHDEEHILEIAVKANPACRELKEKLKVVPVMCLPTTNFSRHLADWKTGQLIEREVPERTPGLEATAVDFE
jgi:hypothetical protein